MKAIFNFLFGRSVDIAHDDSSVLRDLQRGRMPLMKRGQLERIVSRAEADLAARRAD